MADEKANAPGISARGVFLQKGVLPFWLNHSGVTPFWLMYLQAPLPMPVKREICVMEKPRSASSAILAARVSASQAARLTPSAPRIFFAIANASSSER